MKTSKKTSVKKTSVSPVLALVAHLISGVSLCKQGWTLPGSPAAVMDFPSTVEVFGPFKLCHCPWNWMWPCLPLRQTHNLQHSHQKAHGSSIALLHWNPKHHCGVLWFQRHRHGFLVQYVGHQQPLSGGWMPGQMLRPSHTALNTRSSHTSGVSSQAEPYMTSTWLL